MFFYAVGGLLIVFGLLYHFAALTTFNALVPKDGGSRRVAEAVAYGSDPRQTLDVYRPDGEGPFPVLLFAYGGSWDTGRRQDYSFVGHAMASRGFLTFIADYRLVPKVHYPDFVHDTADAAAFAVKIAADHGGDPQRLFFMGHSAGGYNVVQAAAVPGMLEARGIPRGVLRGVAGLAAPADFLPFDSPKSVAAFSRHLPLEATQPVNIATSAAPPMLLLHGRKDKTVGLHNSRNLAAVLTAAGVTAEVKIYDGVSHVGILLALSRPWRNSAPVLDDVVAFFQKYD